VLGSSVVGPSRPNFFHALGNFEEAARRRGILTAMRHLTADETPSTSLKGTPLAPQKRRTLPPARTAGVSLADLQVRRCGRWLRNPVGGRSRLPLFWDHLTGPRTRSRRA